MNTTIVFTPAQFVAMCAAIVTISGAVTVIAKAIDKAKEPTLNLTERVLSLETRLARHDELFIKDNRRLEVLEYGNRITQRAILALLAHGIDGNEVEAMQDAKAELTKFLIER